MVGRRGVKCSARSCRILRGIGRCGFEMVVWGMSMVRRDNALTALRVVSEILVGNHVYYDQVMYMSAMSLSLTPSVSIFFTLVPLSSVPPHPSASFKNSFGPCPAAFLFTFTRTGGCMYIYVARFSNSLTGQRDAYIYLCYKHKPMVPHMAASCASFVCP